jgi:MATE family multidrug resistance protein
LGLVDLARIGQLDDPVYIGAIALGSIIFNLVYTGFGFLRMGTTGFTAQMYGAKDDLGLRLMLWRSILIAGGIGVLMVVLQKPMEIFAFSFLSGSDDVLFLAKDYYRIRIWAAPATLSLYAFYGWFLGMQDSKPPMIIAISINLINIALNFVFVYGLNMSSNGVAFATLIAQYSGLAIASAFIVFKYGDYAKSQPMKLIMQVSELKRFFKVNTDIFFRTIALMLTFTFFTAVSAKMGNDILAVNSLLIQFFFIFSYFADGFAFAGEALAGKAFGARDNELLNKTVRYLFLWGWISALLFSLIYYFGSSQLLSILTDNKEIIIIAQKYNLWVVILPLTTFAAFAWDGVFIGLTASKQMLVVMLISTFGFFLPAYYISASYIDEHSLWFAMNLFMAMRSILMWLFSKNLLR